MPAIDLASIKKTPISMLVGQGDLMCPHSTALQAAGIIGDAVVNFSTIHGVGHSYFGWANDEEFMTMVKNQL